MARPVKKRRVCDLPGSDKFGPLTCSKNQDMIVTMTVDEYECIRLVDYEGLTQSECAEYMNVSRATAQRIYSDARVKISKALVEGKTLSIEGGNYKLCNGKHKDCTKANCGRRHKKPLRHQN